MTTNDGTFQSLKEFPASTVTMEAALAAMDKLHADSYARYTWNKLRFLLSQVIAGHFTPVIEDSPLKPMIRGRVMRTNSVGKYERPPTTSLLRNLSDLAIAPKECVTDYGRCHIPGVPVFYAAFDEQTALAEIAPERESLVYLLSCRAKPGCTFKTRLIGEIDYIRRHRRGSVLSPKSKLVSEVIAWLDSAETEADYVRLVTDAFLADLFTRKATTPNEYRASSALSGLMLGLDVDYPGDCEAIYYPSIANRGGMNIALTSACFAEKVEAVSCKVVLVSAYFGHSIYKTQTIATADSFGKNGEITWVGVKK